ncbi:hypothetical protein F511_12841 [Dorcoceras hygrometricum]|uniref:Uncharacterized protein n=1 Tax=Dorcoceras hygrometricum TaxID=472368 RepID=A0A2Z7C8L3_9LAMI|nr:hypothetical protein F511_12841 [Dorcoceras hygrometricum]
MSPDSNLVERVAESVDRSLPTEASHREDETPSSAELHRARILKINQDESRLAAQGCTWYEIKASTLRESDISSIKNNPPITELYEVVVPHVHARAHRPPADFHTFYINQIDRGLRFPIPKFITRLCGHLEVSPSQLTPNSFSSLLSLGILMKFHNVPISTYTLMQLIQIKRLGPGKFYISKKKEFSFIGGNPSSHKGWMSRYLFIRRILSREDFWRCNMSWRDDAHTLSPLTPEPKPDLTRFLKVMRGRCFNAQQLIEEDLLCFFNFSGKRVRLVGGLDERMGKAEMLRVLEETEEAAAPPKKVTKKSKASTPAKKEARRQRKKGASTSGAGPEQTIEEHRASKYPIPMTEERPDPTSVVNIPEVSSPERGSMKESGPGRVPPLNYFEDSLVVSPTAAVATKYLCHMAPDRDLGRLAGASDTETVGLFASQIASRFEWSSVDQLLAENMTCSLRRRLTYFVRPVANVKAGISCKTSPVTSDYVEQRLKEFDYVNFPGIFTTSVGTRRSDQTKRFDKIVQQQLEADARIQGSTRKHHVLVTVTHVGTNSKSSLCICWFIDVSTGFDDVGATSSFCDQSRDLKSVDGLLYLLVNQSKEQYDVVLNGISKTSRWISGMTSCWFSSED